MENVERSRRRFKKWNTVVVKFARYGKDYLYFRITQRVNEENDFRNVLEHRNLESKGETIYACI